MAEAAPATPTPMRQRGGGGHKSQSMFQSVKGNPNSAAGGAGGLLTPGLKSKQASRTSILANNPGTPHLGSRSTTMSGLGATGPRTPLIQRPSVETTAIAARKSYQEDPIKLWAAVGAKLSMKHSFGSSVASIDPIQSFPFPAQSHSDKDYCDRIIYRAGTQVCISDVDSGKQFYLSDVKPNVTNAIHFTLNQPLCKLLSVCESLRVDREEPVDCAQVGEERKKERRIYMNTY